MTIFGRADWKRVQVCRCAGVAGAARCIVSSRIEWFEWFAGVSGGEEGVNLQVRAKGNKLMLASVELDDGAAQKEKGR